MNKHTPGPWKSRPSVHGNKYRYVQIGKESDYTTLELKPADARLIAAAPELLDACRLAHSALDRLMGDTDWPDADAYEVRACQALMAAIAKASPPPSSERAEE